MPDPVELESALRAAGLPFEVCAADVDESSHQHPDHVVKEAIGFDGEAHAALIATELPRLRVHLKNDKMKDQFFKHDYPSGSIFYRTPDLLEEGTRVVCEVKHPDTGKLAEVIATVTEVVEGARRKRGIRLEFEEMSEASTSRFDRFERGEASEAIDDDAEAQL